MNDLSYLKDNIMSTRWRKRYNQCSQEVKDKLDKLSDMLIKEYQLQVIKEKENILKLVIYFKFGHVRI